MPMPAAVAEAVTTAGSSDFVAAKNVPPNASANPA